MLDAHNVEVHHMCESCEQTFANDNDLRQHKRVHLPPNIKCLGCRRHFSEFSAMVIHLESGNCERVLNLDDLSKEVYYMPRSLGRSILPGWLDDLFCCPTCAKTFKSASGLLQHVDTLACEQDPAETIAEFRVLLSGCIEESVDPMDNAPFFRIGALRVEAY